MESSLKKVMLILDQWRHTKPLDSRVDTLFNSENLSSNISATGLFFYAYLLLFSFKFLTPLFFFLYLYNFLRPYLFTIYARLVGKFSWVNNLMSMESQNGWQRCLLSDILCNANSNNLIFALL